MMDANMLRRISQKVIDQAQEGSPLRSVNLDDPMSAVYVLLALAFTSSDEMSKIIREVQEDSADG